MTCEDQAFVANMVVTNPTGETMATNVINRLIGAIAKLSTIARICKFKGFLRGTIARICKFKGFIRGTIARICKFEGFYKGHHFIPMAMEVHGTPKHDMDHFIECVHLFHDR